MTRCSSNQEGDPTPRFGYLFPLGLDSHAGIITALRRKAEIGLEKEFLVDEALRVKSFESGKMSFDTVDSKTHYLSIC